MATVTNGFKIWDSTNFISCCSAGSGSGDPSNVIQCGEGWNPRPAQITPKYNCDIGTITWFLNDNITGSYPSVDGARNGIAVTNPMTNEVTLWDVTGSTPAEKLAEFLPICNCTDCTGNVDSLAGEYECDYPDVPVDAYCYNVVFVGDGRDNTLKLFAMRYNAYLVGYPFQTAYNPTTGSTTYRVCLNRPIAQIGNPSSQTWTLV